MRTRTAVAAATLAWACAGAQAQAPATTPVLAFPLPTQAAATANGYPLVDGACDADGAHALLRPRVATLSVLAAADASARPAGIIGLHDELVVTLEHAADFRKCLAASHVDPILFLDDVALTDLKPRTTRSPGADTLTLAYRLDPSSAHSPAWSELFLRSWLAQQRPRQVAVGIGPAAAIETATAATLVTLDLGPAHAAWAVVAGLACVVALFVLGMATQLLRDREATSFSLARTLMTCWVLSTSAAIGLVLLNSGALPPLDGGMALLLLANGATLGSASAIDLVRKTTFKSSGCLLRDLVTDADGLAIHRVQALAVNLLLLGIVWHELYASGTVAALDKGWSALMGISSGVYLYGKASEPT